MNTLTNDECLRSSSSLQDVIHNGTLCAFARRGRGACNNDNGGPLASNRQLIGVLSWVIIRCARGFPDGFTRVSLYLNWIKEISGVVAA